LTPNGATFIAKRGHADSEFLASTDNWFRPVLAQPWSRRRHVRPRLLSRGHRDAAVASDDIKKRLNLESRARGRIWRVRPDGDYKPIRPALDRETTEQLVKHLADDNAWWRTTAQRLLLERKDEKGVEPLRAMARQKESARGRRMRCGCCTLTA